MTRAYDIKQLIAEGWTVHTSIRNLAREEEVGLELAGGLPRPGDDARGAREVALLVEVEACPAVADARVQAAGAGGLHRQAEVDARALEAVGEVFAAMEIVDRRYRDLVSGDLASLDPRTDDSLTLNAGLGRRLGLRDEDLRAIRLAGLLHDIGKLAIPDEILLKPTSLTDEEWELMRSHSDEGARMIERVGFVQEAAPAIRHHHERFDGRGNPYYWLAYRRGEATIVPGSDLDALAKGAISVTALRLNLTAYDLADPLRHHFRAD